MSQPKKIFKCQMGCVTGLDTKGSPIPILTFNGTSAATYLKSFIGDVVIEIRSANKKNGYVFFTISDGNSGVLYAIVKDSFWQKHHRVDHEDDGVPTPTNFSEVMPSVYVYDGDNDQAEITLLSEGFTKVTAVTHDRKSRTKRSAKNRRVSRGSKQT